MSEDQVLERLDNLDRRLDRIEQFLPTLATKEELRSVVDAAIAPLATKDELRDAVAKLATKEELRDAVAKLATKEELREEGERSRRYMLMLVEEVRADIRLFADAYGLLDRRDAQQHTETMASLGGLDRRVTVLEAKARRRRVQ